MRVEDADFQTIYETFQPKISRYVAQLVGAEEAEDVTQDVFTKVNRGLERFRGESHLSTWIYRIATNAAVDRLRSPSFQRTIPIEAEASGLGDATDVETLEVLADEEAPSSDDHLARMEMQQCIRDFVDHLPVDYRTVLVLSEMEGLKNREIADILGVSLETVKIRLHRGRAKLKKILDTHCHFYSDERGELACELDSESPEDQPNE